MSHSMDTPSNSPSSGNSVRRNQLSRSVSTDHLSTVVKLFRIVRSASVGNRTNYKIEKPHTNIDWDPTNGRMSDRRDNDTKASTPRVEDWGKTDVNDDEVFADNVVEMRDNTSPDINMAPDPTNKRRILLVRRNSSSHCDSDSQTITGDNLTSTKHDHSVEMFEAKKEEQISHEDGDRIDEVLQISNNRKLTRSIPQSRRLR